MNFTCKIMILYILILATDIDFILPLPIFQQKAGTSIEVVKSANTRFTRQVVQPTWLNNFEVAPIDPIVHIDQRALEEAEEIRRAIQTAVNEGTYAIAEEQPVPHPGSENLPTFAPPPPEEVNTPHPPHPLPSWHLQMQKLWESWAQSLFSGFEQKSVLNPDSKIFPTFAPTEAMNTPQTSDALANWYLQMQKLWEIWTQNLFSGFRI